MNASSSNSFQSTAGFPSLPGMPNQQSIPKALETLCDFQNGGQQSIPAFSVTEWWDAMNYLCWTLDDFNSQFMQKGAAMT